MILMGEVAYHGCAQMGFVGLPAEDLGQSVINHDRLVKQLIIGWP